ncbi:MAG: response regulator [Bacteroidota bacterium]
MHHALLQRLESQRTQYLKRLPDRLERMHSLWTQIDAAWNRELVWELALESHRLAGSGATFGFPDLGQAARTASELLQDLVDADVTPSIDERFQIGLMLEWMHQEAGALDVSMMPFLTPSFLKHTSLPDAQQRPTIIGMVSQDTAFINWVSHLLHEDGHTFEVYASLSVLDDQRPGHPVRALIVDLDGLNLDGRADIPSLAPQREGHIPMVCISTQADLDTRLQAVRLGGQVFLPKPISATQLRDLLRTLPEGPHAVPYRALIVDDDDLIARCHAAILESVGIQTEIITDPRHILTSVAEFQGEVILMDLHMPYCNGLEMRDLLQQHDAVCHDLSFIFLSTESSEVRQSRVRDRWGDLFLTKPVPPSMLIDAVRTRARDRRFSRLATQSYV